MNWFDFWVGLVTGAIAIFLILCALSSLASFAGARECSRWNHGTPCEMVWVPKGETK